MEQSVYILKIAVYILYVLLIYMSAKKFKDKEIYKKDYSLNNGKIVIKSNKISIQFSKLYIILYALLFGLYSITVSVKPYSSDRGYYAKVFGNTIYDYQLPKGYSFFTKILYYISENPDFLFFAVSFFIIIIILLVYRKFEISNPEGLLLLFTSLYFIYGFHLLKQGIAIAFGTVSIEYILKKKKIRALFWGIIAVLFHESALILIVVSLALIDSNKKWKRIAIYLISITIALSFSVFAAYFSDTIARLVPSFGIEMGDYFKDLNFSSSGLATALKGMPVYIITAISIIKRKKISKTINNYDKYLILSVFTSITYILSSYMYWMYRFGLYSMFFVFMFFGEILRKIDSNKEKTIYILAVYGITAFLTIRYLSQMFFIYGGF